MNIFVLDTDVEKCAEFACNKHVIKMILESSQLLCSPFDPISHPAPYRRTHYNHPCAVWCRSSRQNYEWLLMYVNALLKEYSYRYDGKMHKSGEVVQWCQREYSSLDLPDIGLTPFALAMPEQYRSDDAVKSYRSYYIHEKRHIAEWKKRPIPYWFDNINKSVNHGENL